MTDQITDRRRPIGWTGRLIVKIHFHKEKLPIIVTVYVIIFFIGVDTIKCGKAIKDCNTFVTNM